MCSKGEDDFRNSLSTEDGQGESGKRGCFRICGGLVRHVLWRRAGSNRRPGDKGDVSRFEHPVTEQKGAQIAA